jgi:excisionase family DNA binding protein
MIEPMEPSPQPLLWTVEQAMQLLQVGRSKFYRLVNQEGLPLIKSGRWVRVSPDALKHWIDARQTQQG